MEHNGVQIIEPCWPEQVMFTFDVGQYGTYGVQMVVSCWPEQVMCILDVGQYGT